MRAGFLGHDDRDRVVLLRQANRRAMARPKFLAQSWVHREREKAGGGGNPIVLHDDRAVVQRRRRLEDAHEQVVGEHGFERNAALDVVAQTDLALDRR